MEAEAAARTATAKHALLQRNLGECHAILRSCAQVHLSGLRVDRLQWDFLSQPRDAQDALPCRRRQRNPAVDICAQGRNGRFAVVPRAIHFDVAARAQATKAA